MAGNLACDKFWVNKNMYHDAEKKYYENLAKLPREKKVELFGESEVKCKKKLKNTKSCDKELWPHDGSKMEIEKSIESKSNLSEIITRKEENYLEKKMKQKEVKEKKNKKEKKCKSNKEECFMGGVGMARLNQETFPKTSLAGEVAKARQHIKSSLECMDQNLNGVGGMTTARLAALIEKMEKAMETLTKRVDALEKKCATCTPGGTIVVCPSKSQAPPASKPAKKEEDDDDDVDLFGSDPEEEDEESKKIREQRLAEYAAKKSKKPAVVAKSNIILDIKPWDDETDMKEMEKAVRGIEMDGLIWGASKLVPVAFKIFKLQISCVIEDDKVSVDLLTEKLEDIEDYIQSVDIAAFNKV